MNWKIVAAFATGAVMASGIVYMAVRPGPTPQPPTLVVRTQAQSSPPAVSQPAPVATPEPAPAAAPEPAPKPTPAAVHEKPSPMPPPIRKRTPPVVARNQVPRPVPEQPAQEPVPEQPAQPVVSPPAPEAVPPAPQAPPEQPALSPPPPPVTAKPEAATPSADVRVPNTVVLAAGTPLTVRIGETISASRNQIGDSFFTTLDQPLVIDGFIIAERGARVEGRVADAKPAGRGGSTSHLEVSLVRLSTSDGQRVRIRTEPYKKDGSGSSTGQDLAKVGAGAAIGAAIGAIAGGGKGAAIGAGAGAAAGAGTVLISSGKPAEIPVETRLTFHVQESVTLTEKLD